MAATLLTQMAYEDSEHHAWQAMEAGNYVGALPLLKALAERNSEFALLSLGWIYESGAMGAPDTTAACSFYEHAAQLGSAEAFGRLGSLLLDLEQEEQAEATFKQGAELGDELSLLMLNKFNDKSQEQCAYQAIEAGDYEEALRLLKPLGARSSTNALLNLGWIYETGKLGLVEVEAAISCYERAAILGDPEAYLRLGLLLSDTGRKVEARKTFEKGAEMGSLGCMNGFGSMLFEGQGGPADATAGIAWLERAANNGHFFAKRKLLSIAIKSSKSIFTKIVLHIKIVILAVKTGIAFRRGVTSDRLI